MSINENALQWQSGLLETRITNDVQGPGRAWIDTIQFLGRRMETPFQLTGCRPIGKSLSRAPVAQFPCRAGAFESVCDGHTSHLPVDGRAGGFFKLAEPVLMQILQRQWQTNLANLKDVLEAQLDRGRVRRMLGAVRFERRGKVQHTLSGGAVFPRVGGVSVCIEVRRNTAVLKGDAPIYKDQ